ncbi:MAG TPA: ankyrin repeat domain-containing protein [Candidatus Limnocylindrales bacterium]
MSDSASLGRDRAGRTLLHYAALSDDLGAATHLVDLGADPNAADQAGFTPLHFAAQEGSLTVAGLLLELGADANAEDRFGNTPLWTAVLNSRGRGDLILLLRERGADPFRTDKHGRTPLDLAQTIANYSVAQWFADVVPAREVPSAD